MKAISTLAENLLKATGLYSDVAIGRIDDGLESNPGMPLLEGILKFGGEKETLFLEKIGGVLGLEYVDVADVQPRPDVIAKLPASAVYQYNAIPIRFDGSVLTVAAADPFNTAIADGLRLAAGCPVRIALAPAEEIDKAVKKFYGVGAQKPAQQR